MLYRIKLDLAFTFYAQAHDILDKALDVLPTAHTINPGEVDEERGFITLEECYHDESPSAPCIPLEHRETT